MYGLFTYMNGWYFQGNLKGKYTKYMDPMTCFFYLEMGKEIQKPATSCRDFKSFWDINPSAPVIPC